MEELYQVYERHQDRIGYEKTHDAILLPIYHSTANAQVEVTIDAEGNFRSAKTVDKEDAVTIIPVTMDSAARSSGIAPHPLCDKLIYIAGDYQNYIDSKKDLRPYHELYMEQLDQWVQSPYSTPKVSAIYNYLKKACLIRELITEGVFQVDDRGKLLPKEKIQGISQEDVFIRFQVMDNSLEQRTWLDRDLYENYIRFVESSDSEKQLCYVTGEMAYCTEKHPGKIRNTGDKARLISGNDESGFTYRGRFREKGSVSSVGYGVSEKAHDALKWLIARQGWHRDSLTIVCWENHLASLPSLLADTGNFFAAFAGEDEDEQYPNTGEAFARQLNLAMDGYRSRLATDSRIIVMGLDSAVSGKGRLAITLYREIQGSRFLDHLEGWHQDMAWYGFFRGKPAVFAPSPERIAAAVYGTEQGTFLKAKDDIIKATVDRLLPCMIDGRPIPRDMVRQAVAKASRPQAYEQHYNWRETLFIACSLVKKEMIEQKGVCPMSLDRNCTDRSYLYGRLLAVADVAERSGSESGNERQTNAKRYMSAFSARPFSTWKIIEERLQPYLEKLNPGLRTTYEKLINEIFDKFTLENYSIDQSLDGNYLLGYHTQSNAIYQKKEGEEQ